MLDWLRSLRNRPWLVGLFVGLAAQLLFVVNIDRPGIIYFDETHYVRAARVLIDLAGPANMEHPLLAKSLIALSMLLFGDNPLGWRLVPSLFGALTAVAGFALLWLMLRSMRYALTGAALMLLNQFLFVQARIAMLDVFLGAFLLWAMVLMLWAAHGTPRQVRWRWTGAAVLLGLAVGCKWAAIPYVALAGLAFIVLRLRDQWPVRGSKLPALLSGRDQPHWPGLGTVSGLAILGGVSIPVYLLTFAPAFFYVSGALTLADLIPFQLSMYELQTQILSPHTYQSDWWSWPLNLRPIWYFYEPEGGAYRGVLLVGNPLVMWGGLVAVLACFWAWVREDALRPGAMALLWTASLAIYVVIPKSLGFLYYYHLSALFLCLALAVAFHHYDGARRIGREEWFLAGALLVFFYFYPILSAAPLSGDQAFRRWIWLRSWI